MGKIISNYTIINTIHVLIFCFLFPVHVNSQNNKIVEGTVVDSDTNKPILFAHIRVIGYSIGTVSNLEGDFKLKLERYSYSNGMLAVSCIGYDSDTIRIDKLVNKTMILRLKPSKLLLKEVTITADQPEDIVRKAAKSIKNNYVMIPTNSEGFYRQTLTSSKYDQIYLAEAVLNFQKESYDERHTRGLVKVIKSRAINFHDIDTLRRVKFYGGAHQVHYRDFVMNRDDVLKKFKKYNYQLVNIIIRNGIQVFEINFTPLNKTSGKTGTLYIDENYVIESVVYKDLSKVGSLGFEKTKSDLQIDYMKFNGRYYLRSIRNEMEGYDKLLRDTIFGTTEFITTYIDTTYAKPIPYQERLQFEDVFVDKIEILDTTFWSDYNIIEPNNYSELYQYDKEFKNESMKFDSQGDNHKLKTNNTSMTRILSNIKALLGVNLTSLMSVGSPITITTNGNNYSYENNGNLAFGIFFGSIYSFTKPISLEFKVFGSFGKIEIARYLLGTSYEISLNTNSRPIFIRPGIGISYTDVKTKIGSIETSTTIKNRKLESPIDVKLSNNIFSIQPKLNVGIELTHKYELFLEGEYMIPLFHRDRVEFAERKGIIFKNKAKEDFTITNGQGAIITKNPLAVSNFQFNLGLTMRFVGK